MKSIKVLCLCFSMLGTMEATTFEQNNFTIIASSISSGGIVLSSGGDYVLGGTIGQHSAQALRGGQFALAGGFWGMTVPVIVPALRVTHSGNDILMSWPVSQHTITLESASGLSAPNAWAIVSETPVVIDGENRLTFPATNGPRFYRLVSQVQ